MTAMRSVFIALVFAIIALPVVSAAAATKIAKDEAEKILQEGNYMFMKANEIVKQDPWTAKDLYEKAATHFESLALDAGIRNGKLYYNTGNAYFMANDLGRAILAYRRALVYAPNDPNLVQNVEFARSKRVDKIKAKESSKISEIVFFWHYNISQGIRSMLFVISFAAIWIFLGLRLFMQRAFLGLGTVISVIVSLLFFGSLLADVVSSASAKPGVIIAEEVTAYKGDGETYEPSFQEPLHAGTEFDLIEARRGWLHIELSDGTRGWVTASSVGIVDPEYEIPM